MSHLYKSLEPKSSYVDRQFRGTPDEYHRALALSMTIYVGNLSFFTTEEQIWELFSKAGEVRRIVMGLNRDRMTPCGFAFVEYYDRRDAEDCVKWINGTKLDDRVIRTDFDFGFIEGRQYGRGRSGGQIRDELRDNFDAGRGGYGVRKANELSGTDAAGDGKSAPEAATANLPESLKRKRDDEPTVEPIAKKARGESSRSRSKSASSKSKSKSKSRSRSKSRESGDDNKQDADE